MKKQRTLLQKIIFAIRDILVLLGVGLFIFEFSARYNVWLAAALLGLTCFVFFKAYFIAEQEESDAIFNAKMNVKTCIFNIVRYKEHNKEYRTKNKFAVNYDKYFNVFIISTEKFFTVEINIDKFACLDSKSKFEEFDNYIVKRLHDDYIEKLNKTAAETFLNVAFAEYLCRLK